MGFGNGTDQVRLFFDWSGTYNHEHCDCLGMFLWAGNEEIISETTYRGKRAWNISTAAHNMVVIDEMNQSSRGTGNKRRAMLGTTVPLRSEYTFGSMGGWYAAYVDNDGELLLWDTTDSEVQAAEADGLRSYNCATDAKVYKRTLALVRTGEKSFYIVDIFRVKGGNTHDWMLHGNLSKHYRIALNGIGCDMPPMEKKPGAIMVHGYKRSDPFLKDLRTVPGGWDENIAAVFSSKGEATLRTIMAGATDTQAIIAEEYGIRLNPEPSAWSGLFKEKLSTECKSKFLCIRRKGPVNTFIAVHEVYSENPLIKKIAPLELETENPFDVGVCIKLLDREDIILSGMEYDSKMSAPKYKLTFSGKLLYARTKNDHAYDLHVFGANSLTTGNYVLEQPTVRKGEVLEIESMDRGDPVNYFTVNGDFTNAGSLRGETLFILDGENRVHPYIIKCIESLPQGKLKILTKGETGLIMKEDEIIMTFFPNRRIHGKVRYLIPGGKGFSIRE